MPGDAENSLLLQAVSAVQPRPQADAAAARDKLTPQQIADLTQWVKMGAPWPGQEKTVAATSTIRRGKFEITDKDRAHWAFQPVARPPVPAVKDAAWVANPIDAFILAKLEAKGLQPNPPAAKQELIRRALLRPDRPAADAAGGRGVRRRTRRRKAYEKLVDRLLDSPRYGEQWGRHWLDLVRFAETNSYERDGAKPNAWRYRDYVIRSFNDDKPYDQFVREQLAGDELPERRPPTPIIATGYYRLGIWDDEPTDRDQARYDDLDDIVATTGQVFLGLTVNCARCHDHKIDPIPQKDYYRLLAFFQNITNYSNGDPTDQAPIFDDPGEKSAYEQRLRECEPQARGDEGRPARHRDRFQDAVRRADRPGEEADAVPRAHRRRRPAAARQGALSRTMKICEGNWGRSSRCRGRPARPCA